MTSLNSELLDIFSEAAALNAEAVQLGNDGDIARAIPLAERALAIGELALGADHPSLITLLNNLARLYDASGAFARATPLYERALNIRERQLGPHDATLAEFLSDLASRHWEQGTYTQAEPLYERALRIREDVLGAEHPDTVASLRDLAALYRLRGRHAHAQALVERALQIRERVLGEGHPDTADLLNDLALIHRDHGGYAHAAQLFERALRIRVRVFGNEHPSVATTLNDLALLHQAQGAYAEAEPLLQRALWIYERRFGAEHRAVATALSNLAGLHQARGAPGKAQALLERSLHISEQVLGSEHPDLATPLNNLAALHAELGGYARAEPLYLRALRIREHALGAEHPAVASVLANLANLYTEQAAHSRAEPLYRRALRIRESVLGAEHLDVASSLRDLAACYVQQRAYARAEPMYARALVIRERLLGAEHPDVASSLRDLAKLGVALGAYAEAEQRYERALRIRERALGPEHPAVAGSLQDLAQLHQERREYDQAQTLYERALRIRERALGPEHPAVADSLHHLAQLHQERCGYDQAQTLYKRALLIREHALGSGHPGVAVTLNNLAMLCVMRGHDAQALPLLERALRIHESVDQVDHQGVMATQGNLAHVCWRAGDVSRALDHYRGAVAALDRYLGSTLASLSDPHRYHLLLRQHGFFEALVSFHAHAAPDDPEALAMALTATLRRKGRVLAEIINDRTTLHRTAALQAEIDSLRQRRAELTAQYQAGPDLRHGDALRAVQHEIERLESDVSQIATEAPTIASVQAALPDDATLIEFVRYRRFDPCSPGDEWKEARYVAYLLQREGPPQWVALGEAEPVETLLAAMVGVLAEVGGEARWVKLSFSPEVEDTARSVFARSLWNGARGVLLVLYEMVFAPIRRRLGPVAHYLVSPDAALHRVPFAAFNGEKGGFLVEETLITYLTAGRDLLRRTERDMARTRPLVMAAPEYGEQEQPLPGTAAEATALVKHFPEAEVLLGRDATKRELAAARGRRFIHIATHGFFRRPHIHAASRPDRAWRATRDITAAWNTLDDLEDHRPMEDALDDAGLILAGDNPADAILTAREIAGLDLRGTQLVVLSACDTGVGELAQSEGFYGLRRAFAVAGAETLVVSLWKINDDATSRLMDHYYGGLRRGLGRSEALRQAQLALLHGEPYSHPFYWAAFVAVGDERPL